MIPPEFYENIDRLRGLLTKQVELYGEFKRACRIADLLGVPPKELTGKVTMGVYPTSNSVFYRWRTMEFIVRRDGEEVFRAKLIDVHQDLWPEDVRAEYARHQKRNKPRVMRDA
jgi:hypothetical protein